MINFTSVNAAATGFAPTNRPGDNIVQTPLGGLITPPKPGPKNPNRPQPVGGVVSPRPPKAPKFPNPYSDAQNDRRNKVLKFLIAAESLALLLIGGAALAKKVARK